MVAVYDVHSKAVILRLIFKSNVGSKILLQQGISEHVFYGDLGYWLEVLLLVINAKR